MKEKDLERNIDDITDNLEENLSVDQPEEHVLDENNDKLAELQMKYDDMNDSYLRLNAEFDNYRKRTLKEKTELLKMGSERVLLDVIAIVDDFERAIDNIDKTADLDSSLREGVDLIYTKFKSFLTKHNVKEIESVGLPFDTDKHEALTTIPAISEDLTDKIVDCIEKGYTLDDKVIRYSKVIVAK